MAKILTVKIKHHQSKKISSKFEGKIKCHPYTPVNHYMVLLSDWEPGLGFDFKKPGYPGRVSGFKKCIKLAIFGFKNRQIGSF